MLNSEESGLLNEKINLIFENLDCWRHLPSYQLERRVDMFFSLYLKDILEMHVGRSPVKVIPEFPLHIATLDFRCRYSRLLPRLIHLENWKVRIESRGGYAIID